MGNSTTTHRQSWITAQRVVVVTLLFAVLALCIVLVARSVGNPAPSAAEIAQAVNGLGTFQRPSAMEYVSKTNSCVVGGTVTSAEWHSGQQTAPVGGMEAKAVDYTVFGFKSDAGQEFKVSSNGALYPSAGENLGLQLRCDPATMKSAPSFGLVSIVYGGK